MKNYLKQLARFIVRDEIEEKNKLLRESSKALGILSRDLEKLNKKYSAVIEDYKIVLKDYRIDNIGPSGVPPSYLPFNDPKLYKAKIQELDDVFRNETFRELLAYVMNFHANMAADGKVQNEKGDMIDIPTEHVQYMVKGIKSVWQLIVGARHKKKDLDTSQDFDPHAILSEPTEEG